MENPRPEKVAVVAEVRERAQLGQRHDPHRVPRLDASRTSPRCAASLRAAGGEYKIYKNTLVRFAVQELGLTDLEEIARSAPPRSPSSRTTRPPWPRRSGTSAAPTRTSSSRAGCSAATCLRPPTRPAAGRPAFARGAAGPHRRRPGGADAEVRRSAAGPAPQLRLRPQGPHRHDARRGGPGEPEPAAEARSRARGTRSRGARSRRSSPQPKKRGTRSRSASSRRRRRKPKSLDEQRRSRPAERRSNRRWQLRKRSSTRSPA